MAGFVEGYCHHHPFIHVPTLSIHAHLAAPELTLAITAVGAKYRYEHCAADRLYEAARSIFFERVRRREKCTENVVRDAVDDDITVHSNATTALTDMIKTVLLLTTFATWQAKPQYLREALEYQSLLARYVREDGLTEAQGSDSDDWLTWAGEESLRRTKLGAFCLLNMHCVAFGWPAMLLSSEIRLLLPTSCKEWLAQDPTAWSATRRSAPTLVASHEAFAALFPADRGEHNVETLPVTSPFGNYILMHMLHQRMYFTRHMQGMVADGGPISEIDEDMEWALHLWKHEWLKAPESALDLRNSKGSLSFAATALLGLAHIRAHWNLRIENALASGDPEIIVATALKAVRPVRGPHLREALLHSVHSLNIPVQLGIEYLSKTQAYFWSVMHALCHLESAVFLSKWLETVLMTWEDSQLTGKRPHSTNQENKAKNIDFENRTLHWLESIVKEATDSLDDTAEAYVDPDSAFPQRLRNLNKAALQLWARIFDGCNSAWPFVRLVGMSLRQYADTLSK